MIHFRKRLNIFETLKSLINLKKIDLNHWKKNNDQRSLLLSKSSWSIVLIGIWFELKKKKPPVFLVPSYYCNYTLNLLKILGSKIIFYDIDRDFLPDLNSIKLAKDADICIATHYFGQESNFNKISDYCKNKKILLIEDATHCLKRKGSIGNYGHFTLFSQHKFFSNINGALIIFNNNKLSKDDLEFFTNKTVCINLLKKFIVDKNIITYNNNFRFLIYLIYDSFIKIFKKEKIENFDNNASFEKKYAHPKIDYFSLKLLSLSSFNIDFFLDYRKKCHLITEIYLDEFLNKKNYEVISNSKYDPYFLVLKSQDKIREIYENLKKKGLAVQTWPDLPSEISESSKAFYYRNHLLFIPLNKISLKKLSLSRNINNTCNIKFMECYDKKEWNNLHKNFNSNILQTWEFGNFKKRFFFANLKRFIIRDEKNNSIGLFQAINYKLFGIKIIFLNRGPIFSIDQDTTSKKKITEKIVENLKKNFLTFVYIKPELEFSKYNILLKFKNKKKLFKYPSWCSSKIDLENNELNIFNNFKNSLRSEILKSQNNLSLEIIDQKKNCNWIFERYFSKKNKKKFKTINQNLFKHLEEEKILSICAKKDGNNCSGIIIYLHGKCATYLISYNSEIGRKNFANQFLLWESIKYLKLQKYKYLDLGGIDIETNSSVAKFKLAFNGKLYKLVGTNFI